MPRQCVRRNVFERVLESLRAASVERKRKKNEPLSFFFSNPKRFSVRLTRITRMMWCFVWSVQTVRNIFNKNPKKLKWKRKKSTNCHTWEDYWYIRDYDKEILHCYHHTDEFYLLRKTKEKSNVKNFNQIDLRVRKAVRTTLKPDPLTFPPSVLKENDENFFDFLFVFIDQRTKNVLWQCQLEIFD